MPTHDEHLGPAHLHTRDGLPAELAIEAAIESLVVTVGAWADDASAPPLDAVAGASLSAPVELLGGRLLEGSLLYTPLPDELTITLWPLSGPQEGGTVLTISALHALPQSDHSGTRDS